MFVLSSKTTVYKQKGCAKPVMVIMLYKTVDQKRKLREKLCILCTIYLLMFKLQTKNLDIVVNQKYRFIYQLLRFRMLNRYSL